MKKITSLVLAALMLASCVAGFASCGKKVLIGVQSGTTAQYFVDGDADYEFDGISGYKASCFDNAGLAVQAMKNGDVKYVMVDEAPAKSLAKAVAGVKVIDVPLTEEEYAYGVDKNQPELLEKINKVLAEEGDAIQAIIDKYYTDVEKTPVVSATKDESKAATQLVVATNAEFAPFEYMDGDKYVGIDIEIMAFVAQKLNMELVIENMDFEAVVTSVGKNGVDVAAAGLTVNDKRKESVDFSTPYFQAAQMLIVLEGDTTFDSCKTVDDVLAQLKKAK